MCGSKTVPLLIATLIFLLAGAASAQASPDDIASDQTQECLGCHEVVTPGIVADWLKSRHSTTTPAQALTREPLERRVSADSVPEGLREVSVGCFECHGLNPEKHKDNFEHESYQINVVVSPNDCKTCHPDEVEQYSESKKAHAIGNLRDNPVYMALVESIIGIQTVQDGKLVPHASTAATQQVACFACHGTVVEVDGMRTVETAMGAYEFPNLTNWPNQGVGRINPDGSRGACTACHPRHGFSIEVARKPHTCAQCHLEPDVPAWNIYIESKHGNIYASEGYQWNWTSVPWTAGKDFRAPTCATCHIALIVDTEGEVLAARSHDFGSRLWVRVFGLPYSHPQPVHGSISKIRNADGQPLPTTFGGQPAGGGFLLSKEQQAERRQIMQGVCGACHGTDWSTRYFDRFELQIAEVDQSVLAATQLMEVAWDRGLADPANPFDELIEKVWIRQWLFYANSVRYAAAMSGPDYAAFKNGWWYLSENLRKLEAHLKH